MTRPPALPIRSDAPFVSLSEREDRLDPNGQRHVARWEHRAHNGLGDARDFSRRHFTRNVIKDLRVDCEVRAAAPAERQLRAVITGQHLTTVYRFDPFVSAALHLAFTRWPAVQSSEYALHLYRWNPSQAGTNGTEIAMFFTPSGDLIFAQRRRALKAGPSGELQDDPDAFSRKNMDLLLARTVPHLAELARGCHAYASDAATPEVQRAEAGVRAVFADFTVRDRTSAAGTRLIAATHAQRYGRPTQRWTPGGQSETLHEDQTPTVDMVGGTPVAFLREDTASVVHLCGMTADVPLHPDLTLLLEVLLPAWREGLRSLLDVTFLENGLERTCRIAARADGLDVNVSVHSGGADVHLCLSWVQTYVLMSAVRRSNRAYVQRLARA